MLEWHLAARIEAEPPADWPQQLERRLGQRLRRVGGWTLLALHGARACLDAAGEELLPPGALLCVTSRRGPVLATRESLAQAAERGLPMPFTFMQSQPSHVLATLCRQLGGAGDARFVFGPELERLQRLALLEAGPPGLLFGSVDEAVDGAPPSSRWWRFVVPG